MLLIQFYKFRTDLKDTGIKYLFPWKGMPGCGTTKGLSAMLWGLGKRQNSVSRPVIIRGQQSSGERVSFRANKAHHVTAGKAGEREHSEPGFLTSKKGVEFSHEKSGSVYDV